MQLSLLAVQSLLDYSENGTDMKDEGKVLIDIPGFWVTAIQ